MLPIVKSPNPILGVSTKEITKIDKTIKKLLKEMEEALIAAKDPEGVGLAAPQIGKALKIYIVRQTPTAKILTFINPIVEIPDEVKHLKPSMPAKKDNKDGVKLEGCLSLQNIWGTVWRYPKVHVTYLDETGKKRSRTFSGFLATIIQHEQDHLEGILFPRRVLEQQGQLYKSHKNEKGEEVFDEITL